MPGRESDQRVQYSVKCPCGGAVSLDARGFGRAQPCRSCKGSIIVAWGRDAKNTQTIPVVVRHVPAPGKKALPLQTAGPKRPPMKTQIMPGAKFFQCPCGERNVLLGGGAGKTVNCPGCDRVHVIEEALEKAAAASAPAAPPPGRPAVAPPPEPPPPPPPDDPPAPSRPLRLGEFACRCGEILPPRTSRSGKEFECKACGRKGRVEATQDGRGLPVITPIFTYEPPAAALPKPKPAAVPRPPAAAGAAAVWTCPCGTPVPATTALLGQHTSCASCGREIRLEKRHAPHSTMTMLKPVFAEPAPAVEFQELGPTAACPCGAELPVSEDLAGRPVTCSACGRVLEVVAKNGHIRLRETS